MNYDLSPSQLKCAIITNQDLIYTKNANLALEMVFNALVLMFLTKFVPNSTF